MLFVGSSPILRFIFCDIKSIVRSHQNSSYFCFNAQLLYFYISLEKLLSRSLSNNNSIRIMSYRILFLAYRKPGTTPAQFRTHYEQNHMTKIKAMTGQHFPLSHERRYIHRMSMDSAETDNDRSSERNLKTPATVLSGTQADFDYDALVEMTFEDEEAFKTFYGILMEPENAKWIAEDEEKFMDRKKQPPVVVLGDVTIQER